MKTTLRLTIAAFGLAIFSLSTVVVQGQSYTNNYGNWGYDTTTNGTITITGYGGSGGVVTVPDTIDGLPVTTIGDWAFGYSDSLTSVTIPNSVTSIGIGAFSDATSLTNVTIPNSVTNIGVFAFSGCTNLTAITVNTNNPVYSSVDGVLFDKSQTTLIKYLESRAGSYTIPDSVTTIGFQAFLWCTSLTSVIIPNSVTSIEGWSPLVISPHGAFKGCTGLTNVTLGDGVMNIGPAAFSCCTSLTSIAIPNSVTEIGYVAFEGCTSLTNVAIGNGLTKIGGGAFAWCTGLTSVTIPNSVANIGYAAFEGCTGLTGTYFKGDAPNVDSEAFNGDDNATVYYLPGTTGWATTFGGRPTALWVLPYPVILTTAPNFGIQTNAFGFRISWATNAPVVVEASTTLASPAWSPVSTNTLTSGWSYFSDRDWANYPSRFYRARAQ